MSQDVKTKAIQQVMTSIKNKKQKQSEQKKDAVTTVINSIRNKDAVYRTLDKITPGETARKRLSTIYRVAERNPEAASKMYGEYNALKRDKTSRFYDPYTEATHSSVKYLKDRGYDVDNIDDNWFKKNSWYQDNLTLNDYTNSVKKPGKKASDKEKDAYEIYQLKKAYDNTKSAKKEQEDLRKYLTETATAKDRTMRDDEIIAGINWKKYPTLKKAREYAANGAPMAFTEGIGSTTEDWAYGVLWAAMNNGGTGNSDADIANSYLQNGKTWSRNQYIKDGLKENINGGDIEDLQTEKQYRRYKDQQREQALKENINGQDVKNLRLEKLYRGILDTREKQIQQEHSGNKERDAQRAEQLYIRQKNRMDSVYNAPESLDYGGMFGGWTDDVKNAMNIETARNRVNVMAESKAKGVGRVEGDYSTYNDDELEIEKGKLQNNLYIINGEIDNLTKRQKEINERKPDYNGWETIFDKYNLDRDYDREEIRPRAMSLNNDREAGYDITNNPQATFDAIFGDRYYEELTRGVSKEEKAEIDRDIDSAIRGATPNNNGEDLNGDIETWQSRKRYAEKQIEAIETQQKWNEEYNVTMWKAGIEGDTAYHQENEIIQDNAIHEAIMAGSAGTDQFDILYNISNPTADTIYSFINQGTAYHEWVMVSGNVPNGMKNVALMTDREIAAFNKYYNAGQKDEAMAFINGLQTALSQRYGYYEDIMLQSQAHNAPITSSVATVFESLAQPIETLATIGAKIFGDKQANNPYSDYYSGTRFKNKIRQYVGDQMSDAGKFFYNAGMSAGDSFINVMAGNAMGLTGTALEVATLSLFGTQAFQTSMNESLKETGGDWKNSFIEATLDALIETATEIWSVENLLSDPENFIKYVLKTSFSEGAEEFTGAAFGPMIKEMLGRKNEWKVRADEILGEGGYRDAEGNWVEVNDADTATRQAMREWNHDIAISTASGAVSTGGGIFVGGAQNVSNRVFGQYNQAGKQIRSAETGETSGQDVLLNAALGMNEDTKSNKRAKRIKEKMDAGKKTSDFEIGLLAKNVYNESGEQAAKAAQTIVEDKAYEKLADSGMDDTERREMAQLMSEAVVKGGVDNLSKEQKHKLLTNQAAFNVYKDFMFESETSRETMGAIMDATQKESERQASVSELLNQRKAQETQEAEAPGEQLANEEDMTQATGTRTEGSRSVIVNGQWAKLGNLVADENGNLGWKVTIDGTEQTVKASQIRATDFSTAAIIRQATVNPGMFSNGFVNTLMHANEQGQIKNVGRFLLDAQKVRMAGYLGMQMPANTIGSQAAQSIYNQAKYEHGKNRDAQLKGNNAGRRGKITFMGAEYGTTEWNQAIKNANLDSNQRAQIDAIAGIAQRAGIEVYFRSAEEVAKEWGVSDPEMTYGWESNTDEHGRGISINIEGLDFALGENGTPEVRGQHNMLVTFGHEMTHWLQRNSANGYNQLESFVMGEMRRNGVNIQRRVMDVMERRGLSIEDAMSEIVADACDQILANEEVRDHIQETNQGLFKEIKSFVKDLVGRVKAAIKGMDQSASRDARAMMRSANRLAKVWLGAYDEAISGTIRATEGETGESTTRLSLLDNKDLRYNEQVNQFFSKKGMPSDRAFVLENSLQDAGITEKYIMMRQGVVTKALREESGSRSAHADTISEKDIRATNRNLRTAEALIDQKDGTQLVLKAREGQMPVAYAIHHNEYYGEKVAEIATLHGRENPLAYFEERMESGEYKRIFIRENGTLQQLPGTTIPSQAASLLERALTVPQNDRSGKTRKSQAVIEEDGEEMTLPSLNLARDLYFKGTDAEIEAGEKKLAQREREMKDIIESDDFTALMLKNKAGGRYEILHPSTRKGIRFQLTYYGNDGEPSMHESYGRIGGPVDERENVHSMNELYKHYSNMSYDSDLKLQVLRDNVRFSQAQLDDEYMQAVKSGNVQRQQELVDQAADRNGYTMEVYHGTPTGGFTQFKDWSYFTENKAYADRYNHPSASSIRGYAVDATQPMTYALRMNPGRVFDTRKAKERNLFNKARMEYGMTQLQESGVPDWTDGRDLIEYIEENNLPYDTIILDEGGDGGYGEEVVKRGFSYVTHSNMIKSAEPVTYDDQGKVIPLSERFNKESNDIRFSMAEPVEQVRDLIAVHNLTPQNLLGSLAEDGFTAPSIAVVKAKEGHSKFGTISVIFKKSAIDPLMNRKNKIYGTDAWTPTRSNAQLETEWDYEGLGKVKDRVLDAMKGTEEYYRNEAERWIGQKQYEGATTKQFDDLALEAYGNYGMLAAYLAEKGEEIEKKYRNDKDHSELHEESIPDYNRFLDALENAGRLDEFMDDMKHESIYDNMDKWGSFFAENGNEQAKKVYENVLKDEGKRSISARILGSKLRQFYMFQQDGRKIKTHKEIDRFLMYQAMTEKADRNDFNEWLYNTLKGSIGRTGVYNGVDPYDSYGNERSWEQTHWKPTAENIVKAMYRNHEAKGGEAGGATGLMAKASKEYATIEEVRADRGRLQQIDEEEYKAKVSELDKKIIDFVNRAEETSGWSTDTLRSSLIEAGGEYAKARESAVRKYFRQEKINLTEEQIQEAISLMNEAQEIETGYFEAKPERVVGLDEIYKVIVPANETEVIAELEKHGIPYETTDGTDEDRLRVLNEQDEARFSKYTHDNMDVEEWMSKAKPWNLVTEDERELLDKYNGLRTRRGLLTKTVLELKADIKRKESILDKLTPDELKDLERAKIKLEEKQQKLLETEDELFRVTSTEGYAGMMYRNNVVLNDWILGKTQDDVREAVEQMVDQVKAGERSITAQVKALRKLADSQAVKAVSSMVEKKSLAYAVTSLKKQLNSDMRKTELESRLIEMALKKENGEDIQEDARLLAVDLTNQMRGYQLDVMERMRGVTITIGPDQQAEMKGKGMTLDNVRERLKGTGIKVEYGDRSSLDTDTQDGGDLRTLLPEMPQEVSENSADALFRFIDWATDVRNKELELRQSMIDIEEETTNVLAIASAIKVNLNNQEYRKQNEAAAKTRQAADELEQAGKTMSEQTELAGRRAVGFTSVLQRDVHQAIEYYNKVAKVAAQEEKNKVRKNLIEELKSENTRKLMEQRDKYEEMMKSDRRNRELAEDNMQIRNRINTIASRINKRLTAETDLKNIPQEAKPLARQVLKMLLNHDFVYRHVLVANKKQREAAMLALRAFDMRDGGFDAERDLAWLVVGQGEDADYDIRDKIWQDLVDIETGLLEYRQAEGHRHLTLKERKDALNKIEDAIDEVWRVIKARETANLNYKNMLVSELALQARDNMAKSRFRGEWTGFVGHGVGAVRSGVVYGNMTPEYFFKNLRNKTISQLYDEYHRAENRNGLEVGKAKKELARIAAETGYSTWDQKKRYTFQLVKGGTVSLTLGEMMSLYATWEREEANRAMVNGPEGSFHLNVGGFYTAQEEQHKVLGREIFTQKAHRLTEADMTAIKAAMTQEQIEYVNQVVKYMTEDIGALGNEASMRMYGIKKYNEKWYFPFEIWEGVKSKKSDQGAAGNQENRAAHPGFDKRRVNNASNALVIRDFTETAVKHIAGMINYNTFAPAIEFMNRVLNYQMEEEGEGEDSSTKRNLRAMIGEIYGKDAVKYLDDFNKDVNGGVTRPDSTIYDKLLSTFKKSAVAGSLSVALQQPLSYIRAAMMISPKYLAAAVNPAYYKGSLEEMEKYSGVAVIKRMGKFDMNFGRSAQDFMMPDRKVGKSRKVYDTISDYSTIGPEMLDRATWTRMWTACKLELAAQEPGVDMKSDEFLEKVAERFNDVMRKTQVYDSVLVKSQNMRKTGYIMKALTSFMSEPTLTANVLADAVINAKEAGGKKRLAMAGTTFIMSAILQALVKGVIGAGRSPDDKKTFAENAAYKFASNFISEINPMSLIPGYSDLMEVLMKGELTDDAMGVVGKIWDAVETGGKLIRGEANPYRGVEDSVGQLAQLFSNVPVKNIMRDARAMWNYFVDQPYAKRDSDPNVLKYQTIDLLLNSQNLTGVVNKRILKDRGWETKNASYYSRIYEADKAGKKQKVSEMMEYLQKARNTKKETINEALRGLAKKDESLSSEEKMRKQQEYGLKDSSSWIRDEYKAGRLDRKTAERMYKEAHPKMTDKQIKASFDKIDEQKKSGK